MFMFEHISSGISFAWVRQFSLKHTLSSSAETYRHGNLFWTQYTVLKEWDERGEEENVNYWMNSVADAYNII